MPHSQTLYMSVKIWNALKHRSYGSVEMMKQDLFSPFHVKSYRSPEKTHQSNTVCIMTSVTWWTSLDFTIYTFWEQVELLHQCCYQVLVDCYIVHLNITENTFKIMYSTQKDKIKYCNPAFVVNMNIFMVALFLLIAVPLFLYTSIKLTEQTAVCQKNNCFHFKLLIFEHSSF